MITLLVVLASVVAYFVIGAIYARSQAVACYQRAKAEWSMSSIVEDSTREQMAWRALAWPYALVFDACRDGIKGWFMAPIVARNERAEQLKEDARSWEAKRWTGTEAERAMASELARLCRERADEIRL